MENKKNILVLEKSSTIKDLLSNYLMGPYCLLTMKGEQFSMRWLTSKNITFIIIGEQDTAGKEIDICKMIRYENHSLPIMFVKDKAKEVEVVLALETGATDYCTDAERGREIAARVKRLLRENNGQRTEEQTGKVLTVGDLKILPESYKIQVGNRVHDISIQERKLLLYLYRHRGRPLTRKELAQTFDKNVNERIIDTYISNLRAKIEPVRTKPVYLKTINRVGYVLVDPWHETNQYQLFKPLA